MSLLFGLAIAAVAPFAIMAYTLCLLALVMLIISPTDLREWLLGR